MQVLSLPGLCPCLVFSHFAQYPLHAYKQFVELSWTEKSVLSYESNSHFILFLDTINSCLHLPDLKFATSPACRSRTFISVFSKTGCSEWSGTTPQKRYLDMRRETKGPWGALWYHGRRVTVGSDHWPQIPALALVSMWPSAGHVLL